MATLLTAALVSTACGGGGDEDAAPAAVVDTVHVRIADIPEVVSAVGTVEGENQTTVAGEVAGRVSRIVRDEGSVVARGEPVIQLDPDPYRFALQSAEGSLAQATAQLTNDERLYARYETLLAAGAIDQQTYDDLEARVITGRAAVQQAEAAANTARRDLANAAVRAPFAGTVGHRYVALGEYVDANQPMFDLVDDSPIEIRFRVPEVSARGVDVGDVVVFVVRADSVASRRAEIDYVSPAIDPATRTVEATARYANEDGSVRPGAFVDVEVTTSVLSGAALVPEAAIYTEGTENYVYVIEDGTARRRRVDVARIADETAIVISGLEAGDVAIESGQHGLPDGAPVVVTTGDGETLEREAP